MKNIKNWSMFLNEDSGTPEEIVTGRKIKGDLVEADFKENMLVAPNMSYGNQSELKNSSGRVVKVEQGKVTYKKLSDGQLYSNTPSDLIIINGDFTK